MPHIARNSASLPKAGSISVLMRSKCPSTLGVGRHPTSPPARLTGPVCTALIPMVAKAFHSSSSPSDARNDSPGRVLSEIGEGVNHTDADSTACRGSGLANGFCHMLPWPENCRLIVFASASIDWLSSHDTYAGFVPVGWPSVRTECRSKEFFTLVRYLRPFGRAGWKYSA